MQARARLRAKLWFIKTVELLRKRARREAESGRLQRTIKPMCKAISRTVAFRTFESSSFAVACRLHVAAALLLMASAANAIDMDVLLGFGSLSTPNIAYRSNGWTPLSVFLTGNGVRGVGQLQVIVSRSGNSVIHTRRVPLREGALNEVVPFVISVQDSSSGPFGGAAAPTDVTVQLLVEGRKLAEKRVALPTTIAPETFNVLSLSRDGSGLNFLLKKRMGLVHRGVSPQGLIDRHHNQFWGGVHGEVPDRENILFEEASFQVLSMDPRALPAQSQGYTMVDAIVLADMPLESMTEDQAEALKEYVLHGGLLLISGGGDLTRLKSRFLQELLPIQPTGVRTVADVPDLALRYREPLRLAGPIALTEGLLRSGAYSLFPVPAVGTPLISARNYGAGTIVFTAFDCHAPEFRGWKSAPSLWRDLLRTGNDLYSPRRLLASRDASPTNNVVGLFDALAGKQATDAPTAVTIGLFLAAYIVLLVPVNYLVLKRLDRRELAWLTSPALILAFTAGSYAIGRAIKGGGMTIHRGVIVETFAGQQEAAGLAHLSVYSSARAAYDIGFDAPGDPGNPLRRVVPEEVNLAYGNSAEVLTVENDSAATLRNTLIRLWDSRRFSLPLPVRLGGAVQAHTTMVGADRARVTVTNGTRFTLRNCALINGNMTNGSVELGDLPPGAVRSAELQWTYRVAGTTALYADNQIGSVAENVRSDETTRMRIRTALAGAVGPSDVARSADPYAYGVRNGYGLRTNALVGWFYDPLLDVRVAGQTASGQEVNMLFAHLPLPANASKTFRRLTNIFERPPTLNLQDRRPYGAPQKSGIFR